MFESEILWHLGIRCPGYSFAGMLVQDPGHDLKPGRYPVDDRP
jgi:hypothetical protein